MSYFISVKFCCFLICTGASTDSDNQEQSLVETLKERQNKMAKSGPEKGAKAGLFGQKMSPPSSLALVSDDLHSPNDVRTMQMVFGDSSDDDDDFTRKRRSDETTQVTAFFAVSSDSDNMETIPVKAVPPPAGVSP